MNISPNSVLSREKIVTLGSKLAPSAAILGRLRLLLEEPRTDPDEVINLVRLDPALTFHVTRMSNSILFGVRKQAESCRVAALRFTRVHQPKWVFTLRKVDNGWRLWRIS